MPAAAVIPAPIVYIKVAAVKKLVVGFRNASDQSSSLWRGWIGVSYLPIVGSNSLRIIYFEKIRVFKAGVTLPLNITAWDNRI